LDLTRIFLGPRVTKNAGDLLVRFLDPVGIFFLDLHVFVLDPGEFFSTAKLIVSELGFLFFGPVHLLPGPCLHRVGGELHCYRRSHWAGSRARFFDLAQGGGNLDTETRCMQEVVDAGEVPVLKQ
jgi:hypothetical protein